MKKYKSIIWDWNGTLLDDVKLCIKIVNGILRSQNLKTLDEGEYLDVFGFPISDYYKKIGVDFEKVNYDDLTKVFIGKYETNVRDCKLHEDAVPVLNRFKDQGKRQFILTAAHKNSVDSLLDHYSIDSYFHHVEGLDNYRGESKLMRGRDLVNKRGISTKESVLVGDTNHDFEVAQNLGIDCILIANGHQSKRRLQKNVSPRCSVVDSIHDLSHIL